MWTDVEDVYPLVSSCEQHVYTCSKRPSTALAQYCIFIPYKQTLPNMDNMLRLMQVCVSCARTHTHTHPSINTSIRGMQSAWCIIQWPPVGGFSQCCYHNVCAQILLQLSIRIFNEKVPHSRTQSVHAHAFSMDTQGTEKSVSAAPEIRFIVSPEKSQRMTVNTLSWSYSLTNTAGKN